jgi:manganese transport protein
VQFTSEKAKMGPFVNSRRLKILAWFVAGVILVFNLYLLFATFFPG